MSELNLPTIDTLRWARAIAGRKFHQSGFDPDPLDPDPRASAWMARFPGHGPPFHLYLIEKAMSYSFRKSIGIGPLRLNLLKSGIGASMGLKVARVTVTPRGTTYITASTHGFYYRQNLSERKSLIPLNGQESGAAHGIPKANVSDLLDSSSEQLVGRLNHQARRSNPAILVYVLAGAMLCCGAMNLSDNQFGNTEDGIAEILLALGGTALGIWLHLMNAHSRLTHLCYDLSGTEAENYNLIRRGLGQLAQSHRVWRINGETPTVDWKRNAGAGSCVRRHNVSVTVNGPPGVKANVSIPCVDIGNIKLFFMPDIILCWQEKRFGSIQYKDVLVQHSRIRFIETESVFRDTAVVDQTWRYVNKDGGPDRRFNGNLQLPIVEYGLLRFWSATGLDIRLQTSNAKIAHDVANYWNDLHSRIETFGVRVQNGQINSHRSELNALGVLGLPVNASYDEICASYRYLALKYHPDKVAGSAAEFQVLADTKMKEINAAYDALRERGRRT